MCPEHGEWRGRGCGLKLGDTGRAKAQGVIGLSQALNSVLSSLGSVFFIPFKRVTHITTLQREFWTSAHRCCRKTCLASIVFLESLNYKWLHKSCILSFKKSHFPFDIWSQLLQLHFHTLQVGRGHSYVSNLGSVAFFLFPTQLSPAKENFLLSYSCLHLMLFWPQTLPLWNQSLCSFISRVLFPIINWEFGAHFNGSKIITNILAYYSSFSIHLS